VRHIRKHGEPQAFQDWKRRAASDPGGPQFAFRDKDANGPLNQQMRQEQGYLCAYTMWGLSENVETGIEHIHCQERHPEEALNYDNMVLCAKGSGRKQFGFGENLKGNEIVTRNDFVSPLDPGCEARFVFHRDGTITEADENDVAARKTIELLRLDHDELNAARRSAISYLVIGGDGAKPLSPAKARRLADSIALARYGEKLPPFCIALLQTALRIAEQREKHARRLAARQER
jgi:uncharacterized protein (TIGR02646 family)